MEPSNDHSPECDKLEEFCMTSRIAKLSANPTVVIVLISSRNFPRNEQTSPNLSILAAFLCLLHTRMRKTGERYCHA